MLVALRHHVRFHSSGVNSRSCAFLQTMVFFKKWGSNAPYPAISVPFVASLAHPDWLVTTDAVAMIAG